MNNILVDGALALILCAIGCWAYAQHYHHNDLNEFKYIDFGEKHYGRSDSEDSGRARDSIDTGDKE